MSNIKYVFILLATLMLFAADGAPAAAQKLQSRRMTKPRALTTQKWEYCAITGVSVINNGGKFRGVAELCYFQGTRCREDRIEGSDNKEALSRAIGKLGEDGWEMVGESLFPPGGQDYKALYFKRLKR